jgi:hypothetical protein
MLRLRLCKTRKTFGTVFESDGRLKGSLDILSFPCDQTTNTCQVKVPAPSFALVFFDENSLNSVTPPDTATFSTSTVTRPHNTASVNPLVLATSNGHTGRTFRIGSTTLHANECRHQRGVPLSMIWFFIVLLCLVEGLL